MVYNGWAFIALFTSFIYDVEIMYFGTIKEISGWWILNFISYHFVHIEICFILIETLGESYTFLMYLTFFPLFHFTEYGPPFTNDKTLTCTLKPFSWFVYIYCMVFQEKCKKKKIMPSFILPQLWDAFVSMIFIWCVQ